MFMSKRGRAVYVFSEMKCVVFERPVKCCHFQGKGYYEFIVSVYIYSSVDPNIQ